MSNLPSYKPREIVKFLKKQGFLVAHITVIRHHRLLRLPKYAAAKTDYRVIKAYTDPLARCSFSAGGDGKLENI